MSLPTFALKVAFASDPFDAVQAYTDISAYSRGWTIAYGRQSERDAAEPGKFSGALRNETRRFDPDFAAGPYYPNVLPARRVSLAATLDGTDYGVANHFVAVEDGWEQPSWGPTYAETTLNAVDGFDTLANSFPSAGSSFPTQMSGERIAAVLDSIDWPAGERNIDVGQETVQASDAATSAGKSALDLIREAETTEPGLFFFAANGYATFHDRRRRLSAPYTVSQATFADSPDAAAGELPIFSIVLANSKLVNDWRVTPRGGSEQAAEDSASIGVYRIRTASLQTIHAGNTFAARRANWELSRTAQPYRRVDEFTFKPGNRSDLWEQALARELGDRITLNLTPAGGGAATVQDYHIEAKSLDVPTDIADTTVTWRLSPADILVYWAAGVVGRSEAGVTTRTVY